MRNKEELINIIFNESCLDTLKSMPDEVLDCVITSPPYWQLRDYGYEGQWGLEPTYNGYLEHLWEMMDLIYKKLKPSGTVWINLGDTYGTVSGGLAGKNTFDPKNPNATINVIKQPKTNHKCLLLLPHRFAIGCIDRGWIVRNDIVWAKKNALPESVKDRFSKKHEYMFFMTKSPKYYFDLDSVKDDYLTKENRQNGIVRNRAFKYDSKMNNKDINPNAPSLENIDENEAYKPLDRKKNPGKDKIGISKELPLGVSIEVIKPKRGSAARISLLILAMSRAEKLSKFLTETPLAERKFLANNSRLTWLLIFE